MHDDSYQHVHAQDTVVVFSTKWWPQSCDLLADARKLARSAALPEEAKGKM